MSTEATEKGGFSVRVIRLAPRVKGVTGGEEVVGGRDYSVALTS